MNLPLLFSLRHVVLAGAIVCLSTFPLHAAVEGDFVPSENLNGAVVTNQAVPLELESGPDRVPDWVFAAGMFGAFVAVGLITVLVRSRQRLR